MAGVLQWKQRTHTERTAMDKKEIESLVKKERDAHIEKLIQAKKDLARLKQSGARTHQQELELRAVQKIVDDEPVQIAMLASRSSQ